MSGSTDNAIFGDQAIPSSLQILSKSMPDVSEALLKSLLKLVFDAITKKPLPQRALEKLSKGNVENTEQLFSGLLMLTQRILRLKPDMVKENELRSCLKLLKFTEDCSNEFINIFLEHKNRLYANRGNNLPFYLKLEKLDWRIDISVSSSHLNKSFNTVIIFQMRFRNGELRSFEMPVTKFYLFRLYVVLLLKEFQAAEKKSGLKAVSS